MYCEDYAKMPPPPTSNVAQLTLFPFIKGQKVVLKPKVLFTGDKSNITLNLNLRLFLDIFNWDNAINSKGNVAINYEVGESCKGRTQAL